MTDLETLLEGAAAGPEVGFSAADIKRRVDRRSRLRRAGATMIAVFVVIGLGVFGAAAVSDSTDSRVDVTDDSGATAVDGGLVGRWTAIAYSAVVVAEPGGYLAFRENGELEGSDGCTSFDADWEVVGDRLMISDLGWTSVCGPDGDTRLVAILNGDPTIGTFDREDGTLQLTSGTDFAAFTRAESPPAPREERDQGLPVATTTTMAGAAVPSTWVGHDDQHRLVAVSAASGDVRVLEEFDDPDDFGDESGEPVAAGAFLGDIALSPDGLTVYWESCCEPAPGVIFRTGIDGGEPEQVTFGSSPALSPYGSTLAVVELQWLSVIDLATGDARRIAATGEAPTALANPTWSRDGKTLAFERYDNGIERGRMMVIDVTAESLDAARVVAAPDDTGTPMLPSYDSGGRLHLIRQHGGLGAVTGPAEAIVVDPRTGRVISRRQVDTVREQDHDPSGTYLIRTFTDGTVEYRTGDGAPVVLGDGYLSASW